MLGAYARQHAGRRDEIKARRGPDDGQYHQHDGTKQRLALYEMRLRPALRAYRKASTGACGGYYAHAHYKK